MSNPESVFRAIKSDPAIFRAHLLIDAADGSVSPLGTVCEDWQRKDFVALDPGLQRVVGQRPDGPLRAYLERPRGHAKTSDLAVMASWMLLASDKRISGVAAAGDRDQAALLGAAIGRLTELNKWLANFLKVQAYRVVNEITGSTLDILSADAASSYGQTPSFVIVDELTHWRAGGEELWTSLASSAAKRPNCMLIVIANAGLGAGSSWQWRVREEFRKSLYFSRLEGSQASWVSRAMLDEQRRLLPPAAYDRLWRNMWSSGAGDALTDADIKACIRHAGPMTGPDPDWQFVAGLDLSTKRDHSALVVIGKHVKSNKKRLAFVQSWKPRFGKVSLAAVQAGVVNARTRFGELAGVFYDPFQCALMSEQLANEHQIKMFEVPFVGKTLNEMASTLLEEFNSGQIELYNDAELVADLQRLTIIERSYGFRLDSSRTADGGHSDRGTAFVLALHGCKQLKPRRGFFVSTGSDDSDDMPPAQRYRDLPDWGKNVADQMGWRMK